jgi:hypothetical protein
VSDNNEPNFSRRSFLTFLATAAGDGIIGNFSSDILRFGFFSGLESLVNPAPLSYNKETKKVFSNLFLSSSRLQFHTGLSHYLEDKDISDNTDLEVKIIETLSTISEIEKSHNNLQFDMTDNHDWVMIGAPSSNRISAEIFGLHAESLSSLKANTKFRYQYKFGKTNDLIPLSRYTASGKIQSSTIKAAVIDLSTGNQFATDESGWIEEDYLLITRLPIIVNNTLRHRYVVGGTHGPGTRAFNMLFRENPFSEKEANLLISSPNKICQILARVSASYDHENKKTIIDKINVMDVHVA